VVFWGVADERRKGRRRDEFDGAGCAGSISTVPPQAQVDAIDASTVRAWVDTAGL
jgi:hypothetical protein